ncbi:MAG: MotA/TolQ/ExbB proton channel family protein [Chlamydiota bacterium]
MRHGTRGWAVCAVLLGAAAVPAYCAADSWFSLRYEEFQKGGVLMWPLLACSILALGFAVERFIAMRPDRVVPLKFAKEVRALVSAGEYGRAMDYCREHRNPAASVFTIALTLNERPSVSNALIRSTVEDLGAREMDDLALRIKPLLVISNISPLLGLLGTIFGIIKAFNVVASESGLGRADLLAAGISEALITTASGLLIAIPALAFYHYFRGLLEGRISERMEITLRMFLEDLFERRGGQ